MCWQNIFIDQFSIISILLSPQSWSPHALLLNKSWLRGDDGISVWKSLPLLFCVGADTRVLSPDKLFTENTIFSQSAKKQGYIYWSTNWRKTTRGQLNPNPWPTCASPRYTLSFTDWSLWVPVQVGSAAIFVRINRDPPVLVNKETQTAWASAQSSCHHTQHLSVPFHNAKQNAWINHDTKGTLESQVVRTPKGPSHMHVNHGTHKSNFADLMQTSIRPRNKRQNTNLLSVSFPSCVYWRPLWVP